MTTAPSALVSSLNTMIAYCKEIGGLLQMDSDYFAKNNLNSIEESNNKKIIIMNKLSELVLELNAQYPQGISAQFTTEDNVVKQEISNLVSELRTEIMTCYKQMEVNGSLVFNSLQMLKDIWDKTIAVKNDDQVYNVSGNIVSK